MTLRDQLVKDGNEVEDIAVRMQFDRDIWQNRVIYVLAVALLHVIQYLLKQKEKEK